MKKRGKQVEVFVPYNDKMIAALTEADTNKHYTTSLKTYLSETREIVALEISTARTGGSGTLKFYSNEGTYSMDHSNKNYPIIYAVASGEDRIQYALSNANDTFDIYCFGYWVKQ